MAAPIQTICAFPISSQYAPLVRILTYPLILMSLAGFLPSGSLLTIYTYCSVSSLHLLAMTAVPTHTPNHLPASLDLDIFPAYYLVVLALIITPKSLARALAQRPRKGFSLFVLIVFVLLVWMGTVTMILATKPSRRPFASDCPPTSTVSSCMSCQYFTLPMRSGQTAVSTKYPALFYEHDAAITRTIIGVATAWVLSAFIPSGSASQPSESVEAGGKPGVKSSRRCSFRTLLTIKMVIAWISIGEVFLSTLPYAEKADAIGQWGPVVAFILVALAVGIRKGDDGAATNTTAPTRVEAITSASGADGAVGTGACEAWAGDGAGKGLGANDQGKWATEQDLGRPAPPYVNLTDPAGKAPEVKWD